MPRSLYFFLDMISKRQYPRYAIDATLAVRWDTAVVKARCKNVSEGGMCAEASAAVPPGQIVELELTLVFDEDSFSEPLMLPARAAWSTQMGSIHQVGFQFLAMGVELKSYLGMFLRFLEEGRASESPDDTDSELDPFS